MADVDMRAAKRANAAEELAELLQDPPDSAAGMVAAVGAKFHLLAFDVGLDLSDPDDAATVAAVFYALGNTHSVLPIGFQAAARDAVTCYQKGIQ